MRDGTGRIIDYMRISITDRCNLRCRYCMPDGIQSLPRREILTLEEMEAVAACGARLGIRHIKITGGEPLVRKDCCDLVKRIRKIPGIETVTITTNGILLADNLDRLAEAGIDGINISLDTLDPDRYRELTGGGEIGPGAGRAGSGGGRPYSGKDQRRISGSGRTELEGPAGAGKGAAGGCEIYRDDAHRLRKKFSVPGSPGSAEADGSLFIPAWKKTAGGTASGRQFIIKFPVLKAAWDLSAPSTENSAAAATGSA